MVSVSAQAAPLTAQTGTKAAESQPVRDWSLRGATYNDDFLRTTFDELLATSTDAPPEQRLVMYAADDDQEIKTDLGVFRKRLDPRRNTKPKKPEVRNAHPSPPPRCAHRVEDCLRPASERKDGKEMWVRGKASSLLAPPPPPPPPRSSLPRLLQRSSPPPLPRRSSKCALLLTPRASTSRRFETPPNASCSSSCRRATTRS